MKDTYSRGYKAAALVLLLIELAVLCLPVFGGATAFLQIKGFWQHGNPLQHTVAPLLLLICPAISLFLLLKIQIRQNHVKKQRSNLLFPFLSLKFHKKRTHS